MSVLGGKAGVRPGGASCGAQGSGEGDPIWIVAGGERDGVHEPTDRVVDAEVGVDLLDDAIGCFGT